MYNEICPNCFESANAQTGICGNCGYNQGFAKEHKLAIPPINILNARYLVGRVLGRGGFGVTYLAKDMVENKIVAIKECVPESFVYRDGNLIIQPKEGEEYAFEQCKENFKEEVKALAMLRSNPFVVDVYEYFSNNNTDYFVMEYVDGVTLKYLTHSHDGMTSYKNATLIFLTVSSTLMEIHRKGVIHRDISPENIMIDKNGDIKLIDFGACRNFNTYRPNDGDPVFLKPGFAPPEQYRNDTKQGPWTDIYALGATFYTIISGQPLIDSVQRRESDTLKTLMEVNNEVPSFVSDAIKRSMEPEIDRRYSSVTEFMRDMAPAVEAVESIDTQTIAFIQEKQESPNVSEFNSKQEEFKFPYVEIVSGRGAGQRVKIPDYGFICIGRDPSSVNMVMSDTTDISRQHCFVGYDRSRNHFVIIDKSSNGTYYSNGYRMMKNSESYINPDEEFYVCAPSFRVRVMLK